MASLLERLKLIDYVTTKIPMDKSDFVSRFKNQVDEGDTSTLFAAFEAFSFSKNEYKGEVTFNSFKIRRRKKFFDMNMSLAVAEGTFRQHENQLIIEATIKGFSRIAIPFIIFIAMFYIIFITSFIFSDDLKSGSWLFVPFMFIHAAFMLGIPYFMMRRGVSRMKYELERDFYYMTKNDTSLDR